MQFEMNDCTYLSCCMLMHHALVICYVFCWDGCAETVACLTIFACWLQCLTLVNIVAKLLQILLVIQISFDQTTKTLRLFESMILHAAKYWLLLLLICTVLYCLAHSEVGQFWFSLKTTIFSSVFCPASLVWRKVETD